LFVLVSGKTSQGVINNYKEVVIPKGSKFTQKMLVDIDYNNINPTKWTTDKEKNDQITRLLHELQREGE
jgi:DNA-directed RNA polymerase subunit beta